MSEKESKPAEPKQEKVPAAPVPTGVATAATTTQGLNGPMPAELQGWNWGAFLLNWIWGIGNNVWISLLILLSFIPVIGQILGLGMMIYLGIKGNELAWNHRKFESVEQFKLVQKAWATWGVILTILLIVFCVAVGILLGGLLAAAITSVDWNEVSNSVPTDY